MSFHWQTVNSISEINRDAFEKLQTPKSGIDTPFLNYDFLSALETSESVGNRDTGWLVEHLCVFNNQTLIAFTPAYRKLHSYGEYIFDHSWAKAYHQHGIAYYPKWVLCVPFTPVTGSRILIHSDYNETEVCKFIYQCIPEVGNHLGVSSCHTLFPTYDQSKLLSQIGHMQRKSVQFIWNNKAYLSFDDFLQTMTSRRRRSIKKERVAVACHNIDIKRLTADQLTQDVTDAFYLCYQQTYLKRSGHTGYLTKAFFDTVFKQLAKNILIVASYAGDKMIAGALFFYNKTHLFGRYWGALDDLSGLHFESCYYQGIEFAIERGIQVFNPGTQGEHKILRGFEPTLCYSNHFIEHPEFRNAIARFLQEESVGIEHYKERASTVLPFKMELCDVQVDKPEGKTEAVVNHQDET